MSARRGIGFLRWVLPGLVMVLVPITLAGQSLEERESEYREALDAYEAEIESRDEVASRFYILLDSLGAARVSNAEGVVDQLEGRLRGISLQLQILDTRVEERAESLQGARDALLVSLDRRLDSLRIVAETADDPTRRQEAGSLIVLLRNQYGAVEAQDLQDILTQREVRPLGIRFDPRDTPATLLAKAELLESKAADFQLEIDAVDQALERYRRAVQLDRIAGDARSTIDRFGDTQIPVRAGSSGGRGEQGIAADTTDVDLESLPPQDAILQLEVYRQQLVVARDETLRRAREFRDAIRGVRGPGGER